MGLLKRCIQARLNPALVIGSLHRVWAGFNKYTNLDWPKATLSITVFYIDVELLKALVQAESWQRDLAKDPYLTTESLAASNSLELEYVRRSLFLALLSPRIKEAIICGTLHPQ